MKKVIGLFILVSFIFSVSCVSALGDCTDDQTIMKLSSSNNAHGALWNDALYTYRICYNEIFGTDYTLPTHTCDGENKVIGLSANTNAHGERTSLDSYAVDVCYGDMHCAKRTGSCDSGEFLVVRLNQDTNSHISGAGDSSFPVLICCSSELPQLTEARWTDMLNTPISDAPTGARVKLFIEGENLGGKNIDYTIYKDGWFWDTEVETISSTSGFATWRAGQRLDGSFVDSGTFYFIAEIEGEPGEKTSNELDVSQGSFTPPNTKIISPLDRQVYFVGEVLSFEQETSDRFSYVDYLWDLGDGQTRAGDTENMENYNFTYSYSTPGQKDISLTATNEQGLSNVSRVSILIVNSPFMLAYIDSPAYESRFFGNVWFNASSTYVVNVTSHSPWAIDCLAGRCPGETAGCPPDMGTGCHIAIDGSPNLPGFENIEFKWTISPLNNPGDTRNNRTGVGSAGAVFNRTFWNQNWYRVFLETSLNPSSSTSTKFFNALGLNGYMCDRGFDYEHWIDTNGVVSEAGGDCYKEVVLSGDNDCCRDGWECNSGVCEPLVGVTSCLNYLNEEDCEEDAGNVASLDVEVSRGEGWCGSESYLTDECRDFNLCSCEWNSTIETCGAHSSVNRTCEDGDSIMLSPCDYGVLEVSDCESGYRIIRWEESGEGCESAGVLQEKRVRCPVQLDFFGVAGVITVIVLVILFYYFSRKKKEKEVVVKKKRL